MHDRTTPNGLQRGIAAFKARRRVLEPRFEHRGSRLRKRVELSFRQHATDQPHTLFPLNVEVVVHGVDQLIPQKLPVAQRHVHRVLRECRLRRWIRRDAARQSVMPAGIPPPGPAGTRPIQHNSMGFMRCPFDVCTFTRSEIGGCASVAANLRTLRARVRLTHEGGGTCRQRSSAPRNKGAVVSRKTLLGDKSSLGTRTGPAERGTPYFLQRPQIRISQTQPARGFLGTFLGAATSEHQRLRGRSRRPGLLASEGVRFIKALAGRLSDVPSIQRPVGHRRRTRSILGLGAGPVGGCRSGPSLPPAAAAHSSPSRSVAPARSGASAVVQDPGTGGQCHDHGPGRQGAGLAVVREHGQPADGSVLYFPVAVRRRGGPDDLHGGRQGV